MPAPGLWDVCDRHLCRIAVVCCKSDLGWAETSSVISSRWLWLGPPLLRLRSRLLLWVPDRWFRYDKDEIMKLNFPKIWVRIIWCSGYFISAYSFILWSQKPSWPEYYYTIYLLGAKYVLLHLSGKKQSRGIIQFKSQMFFKKWDGISIDIQICLNLIENRKPGQ